MNKRRALFLAVVLHLGGAVQAAEDMPLTLREAVETALNNRPDVKIAPLRSAGAHARVNEIKGQFLPTLDIFSDVRETTNYDPFTGIEISATINGQPLAATVTRTVPPYEVNTGIELGVNLYAGGLTTARLAEAGAEERAVAAQNALERRDVVLEVATAYWDLKKAQVEQDLAQQALDLARVHESIAQAKWKEGRASELELRVTALRTAESEARLSNAENALAEHWRRYEIALGVQAPARYAERGGPLRDDPETIDVNELLRHVAFPRPTVARAEAEGQAAEARLRAQRAEFYPRLDLYARYNQVGRDEDRFNDALSDWARQDRLIGLKLQWNLFNGLQSSYRSRRAQSELDVSRLRVDHERALYLREAQEKRQRVARLTNDLALAHKRLDIAHAEARIAQVQRNSGAISEEQYRSREFAVKEAAARVTIAKIDLALARLAAALFEPKGENDEMLHQ